MERRIANILISRLKTFRCVALLGSRQVGKSYLLKEVISQHGGTLLSFDDPLERAEATKDPVKYLESRYKDDRYLFIDEAAKVPEIFSAIKIIVDRLDPRPTGICIANSGNYLLMRRIKESLAGRIHLLSIYPFSWQELMGFNRKPGLMELIQDNLPADTPMPTSLLEITRQREDRILWGGYPSPSLSGDQEFRILWASDYIRTYILPLVVEQFNIRDVASFERATQIAFTQSSKFFIASKLAQATGISQPTASDYIHYL